jgi:8-oxo-dGTP pyrophosphatase MutT (NUDIX family)
VLLPGPREAGAALSPRAGAKARAGLLSAAGRVDPGESFIEAALRETREEAGIEIELEGVLRVEHSPAPDHQRIRVFFLARPKDDAPPKAFADEHSLGARWVTVEEASALPLRGDEVLEWMSACLEGRLPLAPMTLLDRGLP